MDCRVVLEAAVPVYDVATPETAVGAAISKVGEQLNPDRSDVDIEPRSRRSPRGTELPPATVAAGEGMVALELGMTVYDVEAEDHAVRIARSEIGSRLEGIPLERLSCDPVEEGETAETEETETDAATEIGETETGETETADGEDSDEETLLPEFEEMVERNRE